jgi:4-hydroxythreonine-4-phosphate dehydrogenase
LLISVTQLDMNLRPLAITLGDAAGIGPEIIAKAFRDHTNTLQGCFVVGDVQAMRRACALIALPGQLRMPVVALSMSSEALTAPSHCIPVLQVGLPLVPVPWGRISKDAGEFAGRCVMWAAQAVLAGEVRAMVTAPLHKEALRAAGAPFQRFPGHTEMLQSQAALYLGKSEAELPVRMMLANNELRTVLVSIHLSLRDALNAITVENVLETIRITHEALSKALGRAPRIAVAGVNPHAGEGGLFGREELDIISPAITAARSLGCDVSGPWAPDTIFMRARARLGRASEFDVVIAMYHDQGLIPVKYLGVEKGVNVTLGLPLIRTSPDHGTAFDIAGTGQANASSLVEAVHMAKQLSTS